MAQVLHGLCMAGMAPRASGDPPQTIGHPSSHVSPWRMVVLVPQDDSWIKVKLQAVVWVVT